MRWQVEAARRRRGGHYSATIPLGNETGILTTLAAGFVVQGQHIVLLDQTHTFNALRS